MSSFLQVGRNSDVGLVLGFVNPWRWSCSLLQSRCVLSKPKDSVKLSFIVLIILHFSAPCHKCTSAVAYPFMLKLRILQSCGNLSAGIFWWFLYKRDRDQEKYGPKRFGMQPLQTITSISSADGVRHGVHDPHSVPPKLDP